MSPLETTMQPISFVDMYGLALLAKKPHGLKQLEIFNDLSPEAKELATEIISSAKTPQTQKVPNEGPGNPALNVVKGTKK